MLLSPRASLGAEKWGEKKGFRKTGVVYISLGVFLREVKRNGEITHHSKAQILSLHFSGKERDGDLEIWG